MEKSNECSQCGKKIRMDNAYGMCEQHKRSHPRFKTDQARRSAAWAARNREKVCAQKRERYLNLTADQISERNYLTKYGITKDQARAMLQEQGGTCGMCKLPISEFGRLKHQGVVDHDHATGRVRGVLCHGCNKALGFYEKHAVNAIDYLRSTQE